MEDSVMMSAPCGTLGTLYLVRRKAGGDVQSFPIDAQKVSIGRDYECDIRLYFSDVSKLHCEINFDLATGEASLHVLGGNGLYHTPAGGETKQHKPPSMIPLGDRDTFVIRKKVFRFEYPSGEIAPEVVGLMSPAVVPSSLPSASPSPVKNWPPSEPHVRRRASHRMSLVPFGKTFVPISPAKSRRHSTLGLGRMATPSKSTMSSEITEEEEDGDRQEEQEEQEDLVIDVVDGEDGDMVYLEVNEEAIGQARPPVHLRGFMTPQPAGKAPLRNTSVAPRTRVLAASRLQDQPAMIDFEAEAEGNAAEKESVTPQTSRNPVPAQVAMTTPRGSSSLRKSLLLRSARKVWEENRSPGIDGAIESGAVEVRRKSLSPKYTNRRSIDPGFSPVAEASSAGQVECDESEEDESPSGEIDSSGSSEMDSLVADVSLDIESANNSLQPEVADLTPDNSMDVDVGIDEAQISIEAADISSSSIEEDLEPEPSHQYLDSHNDEDPKEHESTQSQSMGSEIELPALSIMTDQRFYTPQPQRVASFQPRRSLANIGGPPVRFERLPSTPQSVPSRSMHRTAPTPGTLGRPARLAVHSVKEEREDPETAPLTPARVQPTPALVAEAKRRRETLATPRALPLPPASGFKERIRDTPIGASLVKSTSHPAIAFASPESSVDSAPIPSTPIDHLKKRMADLRRQSVNRQATASRDGRRATVGFALPSTPARSHITPSRENKPSTGELDDMAAYESALVRTQRSYIPPTPSFRGVREMLKTPGAAKTPYMRDLKALFPTTIEEQPSPSLLGVKDLLHDQKALATPEMSGMRALFRQRIDPKTPAMEGMAEMYRDDETGDEGRAGAEIVLPMEGAPEGQTDTVRVPRSSGSESSRTASHRARGASKASCKTTPVEAVSAPSRIPQRRKKDDPAPVQETKSASNTSSKPSRAAKAKASEADALESGESSHEGEAVRGAASAPAHAGRPVRPTRSATNAQSETAPPQKLKRGRARAVLNESQIQEAGAVTEESAIPPKTATKRTTAPVSSRKAPAAAETTEETKSAPTRRTRTATKNQSGDKENEPESESVDEAPKKRSSAPTTRKTVATVRETVSAPARSTRSRK